MDHHKKKRTLLTLLFVLLLGSILLLAAGLSDLRFQPGEPLNLLDWILSQIESRAPRPVLPTVDEPTGPGFWDQLGQPLRRSLIVVFWLFLGFSILYAIVSPEFRRELVRAFMLILTMVVLLPYIARRLSEQMNPQEPEGISGELPSGQTFFPQPPPFVENPPEWLLLLAKGLLLLFIIITIYLLWHYLRPRSDAQAVVARHVRQALTDLDAGLQFDDVVITCYNRMCQELQHSRQVQRQKYMTPREFQAYLDAAGISSVHIHQLTRLFEGARYSTRPSHPARERQARRSLQAILQAYGE